jgi:alkylation response protein AidB-like acyl-CoA dehydrogenase
MDLELTETQSLLRSSIKELLSREVTYDRVREIQKRGTGDTELWELLRRDGWLALPLPEASGGAAAGLVEMAVAVEEITRSAAVIPFMETMACAVAVRDRGSLEAQQTITERLRQGPMSIAPALLEEPGRHGDVSAKVDAANRLTGTKKFVDFGQVCSHHLVQVKGSNGAAALYLVDGNAPGVSVEPIQNVGRVPQANVTYDRVPAIYVGGPETVERLVEAGTVLCSVQLLACAQVALEMAVDYVAHRVQFGRPLGTFQAVQHHAADMATMVEATRYLVYEAACKVQGGTASRTDIAVAKAAASRTGVFVTLQAHQLHGGIGVTEEYHLHFYSRRAKERSVAWGSGHERMAELAATLEQQEAWIP